MFSPYKTMNQSDVAKSADLPIRLNYSTDLLEPSSQNQYPHIPGRNIRNIFSLPLRQEVLRIGAGVTDSRDVVQICPEL